MKFLLAGLAAIGATVGLIGLARARSEEFPFAGPDDALEEELSELPRNARNAVELLLNPENVATPEAYASAILQMQAAGHTALAARLTEIAKQNIDEEPPPIVAIGKGYSTQIVKTVKLSDGQFWVFVDVFKDGLRVLRYRQPRDTGDKNQRVFVGNGEPRANLLVPAARKAFGV